MNHYYLARVRISCAKVQPHFSSAEKRQLTLSERRSEGQDANGINGRGPRPAREGGRLCRIASCPKRSVLTPSAKFKLFSEGEPLFPSVVWEKACTADVQLRAMSRGFSRRRVGP